MIHTRRVQAYRRLQKMRHRHAGRHLSNWSHWMSPKQWTHFWTLTRKYCPELWHYCYDHYDVHWDDFFRFIQVFIIQNSALPRMIRRQLCEYINQVRSKFRRYQLCHSLPGNPEHRSFYDPDCIVLRI